MRRSTFQKIDAENASVDVMLSRDIVSQYDKIAAVAEHIDDVVVVAAEVPTTAIVAASIGVVTAVGSNIDAVVDVHNNTANIAAMVDNFTNMNTVASNIADVNAVADSIEAVDAVNDNMASIHTTVANIANVGAVAGSIAGVNIVASGMADILTANSNIADITVAADNIAHINQVAADTAQINEIVATVVPNMAEILLADDRAATATSMAVTATTARVAAEVAQGIAETKATEAGLSAVAADLSADLAAASEAVATTKANSASASAAAAHVSELAAAAILDTFDDRYLGAFADNPTVDNDGNALTSGALYFNTTAHNLIVYDAGLVDWIALSGVTFAGLQDVNLTSVATGDVLKWNGTDWVNTKTVGLNSLQLLGGVSAQGTMTWNADEETVDVVQNGAILQLGQETQIHVRNSSGSDIAAGKVVMATGALGASSRITAGLYDGTADVKYVLGVATETIADGDDGKVTSFGKIRGINTSAWNEGDVLYATTAGGLTNVAPVTGVKLAVAMVITKHAINGTLYVRRSNFDENKYEIADSAVINARLLQFALMGA